MSDNISQTCHVMDSLKKKKESSTWRPETQKSYDFLQVNHSNIFLKRDVSKKIQDGHHNWLCKAPQTLKN